MPDYAFDATLPSDVAACMLDAVYAAVPAGLCFVDEALRFVAVNEHLAAIDGVPAKAHVGRRVAEVQGDFGKRLEAVYREVLERGLAVIDREISGIESPWAGRSWLVGCFPFRHPNGQLAGVTAVIREITERKMADRARRTAEAAATNLVSRLNFALEKAEAAEWEVDYRTGEARWSPQMYSLYGLPPGSKPATETFLALLHPQDREAWQAEKARVLATRGPDFRLDFRILHPIKGLRWISSRAYVQYSKSGALKRMGGIKIDVTELKKVHADLEEAKEEAERANEAKSNFLAAASHDLRQPLQALTLYHGVLAGRAAPADLPVLQHIDSCLSSLNELLSDLLDLSKLDAGVVSPNMSQFAVDELLHHVASSNLPEAERKGLRLRVVPTRIVGYTDVVLLGRLLGNLVTNAVRYTGTGGIVIGCRRKAGKVWIEVWDSGIGIPEDKTDAIFEPFQQLGNPERSREKGSGLGLAIVKKTAALLGLSIGVRSRLGHGSVFRVELPLGREAPAASPAQIMTAKSALRIAVVEDDFAVREATICALDAMGHQPVAAISADELLTCLADDKPDMVIADYRLTGHETGLDAIAAVRSAFDAPIPAVVLTGDTDPDVVRGLNGQGVHVMHKPLSLEGLRECVAAAMDVDGDQPG